MILNCKSAAHYFYTTGICIIKDSYKHSIHKCSSLYSTTVIITTTNDIVDTSYDYKTIESIVWR